MPGILSERIAALRKERGLTQEQLGKLVGVSYQAVGKWEKGGAPDVELLPVLAEKLGVSIDTLFGLEGGEKVDVERAVGAWLRSLPEKERMERFCRLVWVSIRYLALGALDIPRMEYLKTCRFQMDGWENLMYTLVRGGGGLLLDVHAEDLSFVTLWPEPKEGYMAYLFPMEYFRQLFALLARPGCLELLEELCRRKTNYFVPAVIAKQTGMATETVTGLLDGLEEVGTVRTLKLETEEGEVKAYMLAEPMNLVPLLFSAQSFMKVGVNYIYLYDDGEPLLRGAKWKHQEENHEKAE